MNPNTNITLCVTSCDRHDLLRHTLDSFFANTDIEPQQILIYEDSAKAMPDWLNEWQYRRRQPLKWISDGERKGQAYACARLIGEAKHDWLFWLEDDWLFQPRSGPFMQESKALLLEHPELIKVSLRGDTGWHPLEQAGAIKIAKPYWRGVWGGWAWNPGLSRTADIKALLSYLGPQIGQHGMKHEEALSKKLLDDGRRIADLGRAIVTHIGGCGRSRAIEKLPPPPKILIAVPTCFEFSYGKHSLTNPQKFHVDGPNDQTQAVRDTWAKDFAPYPSVDVRFFYGSPAPRMPGGDEVILDCGDGYHSLIDKTIGICKWAVERGYRWLAKFDTDTLVYADRLLVEIMENGADYAGYRHANVCSGGPGYILSDKAMQVMASKQRRHVYAEDVTVAWTLADAGIIPAMLPGHHSGLSDHFFFGNETDFDPVRLPEDIVTAHAVFPDQMRKWHAWKNGN